MNMRRIKDISCGILISSMVFGSISVAFAKVSNDTIPVSYNNIKIVVDGKKLTTDKEPFIYNGTTYLPVREVAEAVGKNVSWDGATKTVTLGNSTAANTQKYSRTNPAPIGTKQTVVIDNYSNTYTAEVKVNKVLTGDERKSVMGSDFMNDKLKEGYDFVIAEVTVSILNSKNSEKSVNLSTSDFTTFTSNNESIDDPYIYLKDDGSLDATLYAGGTKTGYVVCGTKIGDSGTKIVFGQKYDGTGGIWFSLNK